MMSIKHKILIVEDDQKLAVLYKEYLEQFEFSVSLTHDGKEGESFIKDHNPDLVILDLMLPLLDGLGVCRNVRQNYSGFILMLTAIDDDLDQVAAIEVGVDDYISKPVQMRVLMARIRMLLRRQKGLNIDLSNSNSEMNFDVSAMLHNNTLDVVSEIVSETVMEGSTIDNVLEQRMRPNKILPVHKTMVFAQLMLDFGKRRVSLNQQLVDLTDGEFDLLWLLACHAEQILSRDFLMKTLRGVEYDGLNRSMDTRIVSLRKKIGDNTSKPFRILTVRGKGYMFMPDAWTD